MNLSQRTIMTLAEIITGDRPRNSTEKLSPYRTLGKITDFFRDFGERDLHPRSGAPSRFAHTKEKLERFRGTNTIERVICNALDFCSEDNLNIYLRRNGCEVIVEDRYIRMNGDRAETEPYFAVHPLRSVNILAPSLVSLSEDSITEHIAKAIRKIEAGEAAGAIANACTLIEEFLKGLLRKTGPTFNENEGDIRALYKLAAGPLYLDPKRESLEKYLEAIPEGLQRQIGGLFELSNKTSDRHARKYNPAPLHAKLAVNAAFTLCEFLESFEYLQKKNQRRAS